MGVQSTTAYLDLELQTAGKVKGDSTTTSLDRKNLIEVLAYHHDVVVHRDVPPGPAARTKLSWISAGTIASAPAIQIGAALPLILADAGITRVRRPYAAWPRPCRARPGGRR